MKEIVQNFISGSGNMNIEKQCFPSIAKNKNLINMETRKLNTYFKGKNINDQIKNNSKIICLLYCIGGLAFSEISAIANLDEYFKGQVRFFIGSDNFYTPHTFINDFIKNNS